MSTKNFQSPFPTFKNRIATNFCSLTKRFQLSRKIRKQRESQLAPQKLTGFNLTSTLTCLIKYEQSSDPINSLTDFIAWNASRSAIFYKVIQQLCTSQRTYPLFGRQHTDALTRSIQHISKEKNFLIFWNVFQCHSFSPFMAVNDTRIKA